MRRYKDNLTVSMLVLGIALLIILAGCFIKLSHIQNIMQAQFDYQTERQFCMQDTTEYLAPCRLEMDTDGSVRWYFNANDMPWSELKRKIEVEY